MSGWNVIIVALGATAEQADEIRRRLYSRWSGDTPLSIRFCSPDHAPHEISTCDAAILVADHAYPPSSAAEILDRADEAGIAVIVVLDVNPPPGNYYEFAGAITNLWSDSDESLCALLKGMLHRQTHIKRFRSDAAHDQRCHGGLKGQITKMHDELQLAATVQREFLPRELPTLHGVQFAALWRPSNYVSGDIYDVIQLDEDRAGVFIADAVGHGVPAALMTMVICRALITRELDGDTQRILKPAEVLERLNAEMIRRQGQNPRFATAVYAVIDCRKRTVEMAGAGHPSPILLREDGTSDLIDAPGSLLGVFPDEVYQQTALELTAGDRLLFYTDGFEQAFPESAETERHLHLPTMNYRTEFAQLTNLVTAAEMVENINRRLDDQAGSLHQIDDLTFVCVNAQPLPAYRDSNGPKGRGASSILQTQTMKSMFQSRH